MCIQLLLDKTPSTSKCMFSSGGPALVLLSEDRFSHILLFAQQGIPFVFGNGRVKTEICFVSTSSALASFVAVVSCLCACLCELIRKLLCFACESIFQHVPRENNMFAHLCFQRKAFLMYVKMRKSFIFDNFFRESHYAKIRKDKEIVICAFNCSWI